MALQEKEFVVKNGLDVKNGIIKLGGVAGAANQLSGQNAAGTAQEWKSITSGQGINIVHSVGDVKIETTGALPANVTAIGNLTVGVDSTWSGDGTTTTVTYVGHGLVTGNNVYLYFISGSNKPSNASYSVTKINDNSFTITHAPTGGAGSGNSVIGGAMVSRRVITIGETSPVETVALSVKQFDSTVTSFIDLKDSTNASKFSMTSAGVISGVHNFYIGTTAINIGQATGTLTLPNSALSNSAITIGSTSVSLGSSASSFSGLSSLSSSSGTGLSVTTGTTGVLTLDSGTTGAVNIGTNANEKVVTIGNTTGASGLLFNSGTAGIKIPSTSAETSATYASMTGALRVAGGIGVAGNTFIGGTLSTDSSLTITGTPSILAGSVANTASIFNTTTGTIQIGQLSDVINIGKSTSTTTFGGQVSHSGLVMTVGSVNGQKVDQKYTYATSSIALSDTSWTDSGLAGTTQLMTGIYAAKIQVAATNEYYYGMIPWYSGNGAGTLGEDYTEIPMTKMGDGTTSSSVFLRVFRTASGAPKVQLKSSSALSAAIYNFTFRKMMD